MKQFNITLRKVAIGADITVRSIPLRLYSFARNKLLLLEHRTLAMLRKSIRPSAQRTVLKTGKDHIFQSQLATSDGKPLFTSDGEPIIAVQKICGTLAQRTIFEKTSDKMILQPVMTDASSAKMVYGATDKLVLSEKDVSATRTLISSMSDKLLLIESSIANSIRTISNKINHHMILDTETTSPALMEKFAIVEEKDLLKHEVAPTSIKNTQPMRSVAILNSIVTKINFTKLRTLGEMDTDETVLFTMAEFDDMPLEDIDYITI